MVYSKEVMQGDIICMKGYALEIKEIRRNSVEGQILSIGVGSYAEAWAKTSPWILNEDLIWHLGFELEHDKIWVMEIDSYKLRYNLEIHKLMFDTTQPKRGFGYFNVLYLHQMMQIFRLFKLDTINFYRTMKTYKLPNYGKEE